MSHDETRGGGKRQRPVTSRALRDPYKAGLDLLRSQVLFLFGSWGSADLAGCAASFDIAPESWGPGAAAYALRLKINEAGKRKR